MGFFTNNWGMANAFSDPQVGRQQQIAPGAGPLSSSQNLNPNQWSNNNNQQQRQTNWGAPNAQQPPTQDNMFGNQFGNQQQPPWWWLNQQQQGNQPYQEQKMGITGGGSYQDTTNTTPADLSPQGYQDYLGYGRNVTQGLGGLLGPVGGLFGLAADYNYGYNTFSPNKGENLGFQNPFTDNYTEFYNENYQGPGSESWGNMEPSEQRDMLINQNAYDTDNRDGMFGGWGTPFGNQLNYDPDMDLGDEDDWVDWNDPGDFDDDDFDGDWNSDDDGGWGDDYGDGGPDADGGWDDGWGDDDGDGGDW